MERQKILLVDDSQKLLKLGKAIFETGGYEIITAGDGVEALAALASHTISLIITDILMPNMDGYTLCYQVRNDKQNKNIPIIIYSATYISESDEKLAIEIGADLFIRKPASMGLLLKAAKDLIDQYRDHSNDIKHIYEQSEVTRQYNIRLVEKLEDKNQELERTQAELIKKEQKFRNTLDNMLEGAQIHDANWRYTYVNDTLVNYSTYTREELIGYTLMEKYPGIENTELFRTMERVVKKQMAEHLETEFVFPNGTKAYYELSIEPIPEGIFILSVDRTVQKKTSDKLLKVSRLYSFISAINQSIVHITREETLLNKACVIAVETGKFKMAWIAMRDENDTLHLAHMCGDKHATDTLQKYSGMDFSLPPLRDTPVGRVLRTGRYAVSNDVRNDPATEGWEEYYRATEIKSILSMPLKRSGKVIGVFGFNSSIEHFFDTEEIALLEEAAADISFALENFDNTKKHGATEALLLRNEKRFRALIEKSADMKTLVNREGMVVYASPSVTKVMGYTIEEFERTLIFGYIHPDDLPVFTQKRDRMLETPGASFSFMHRRLHKNGNWIWCEGTMTNLLDDEQINAIVGNFRDVTDRVEKQKQIEFEQSNINALVNNTKDLMWSVDRNYRLITSNKAFDEVVLYMSAKTISRGDDVLSTGFSAEQLAYYRNLYDRAFSGETFQETQYTSAPTAFWSELSFYPIREGDEVIGTACYAHDITGRKLAEEKIIKANRLYAFTSQINQTIVHVTDEQTLFDEACRIAVTIGKFELACIDLLDESNRKLNLVAQNNALPGNMALFSGVVYSENGAIANVLRNDTYHVINDFAKEPEQHFWTQYAFLREFQSSITLPIKKAGKTRYILSLFSTHANIFDKEEIALVEQAVADISFALDVFEKEQHRIQMVEQVVNSELQLKQAQAIAHFGSWDLNFSVGVATWSDEACRIYGFDPADNKHSYEAWLSFVHPDDVSHVLKESKKGRDTLSSAGFYHRIIRRDGEVRYLYSQSEFDFGKDGRPVGIHGVAHDLTEKRKAEESLLQSEANLRLIMDLIPQSIFVKDCYGRFVFINKSFAALHGLTPEEMINRSINETIPVMAEAASFIKQDQEVILSGATKTIREHSFTDAKGNIRLFHVVKVPFTVVGTGEKAVLGIAVDITEEKNLKAEREKLIDDIVQRNKNLEQFSYIISHNLRAPVANIIGLTEMIRVLDSNQPVEKELIDHLGASVQKLDNVIMDLNLILQIRHTENKQNERVVFSEILTDVTSSIDLIIVSEGVQIISDFSEINEIITIKSFLHSIFFNLISNSIKYRRPDINNVIKITSKLQDNKILLSFKDNGLGIDLEKNGTQVFGLYKRFHYHVEGKGMGLFMVKTQVESLGGKITVSSEVNNGTEFRIEFENNQ